MHTDSRPLAPASGTSAASVGKVSRTLVQAFCERDNFLSAHIHESKECDHVLIAIEEDFTSERRGADGD